MITAVHKNRRQCKQTARSLSLEYRTQLALAKEENGDITAANFLKNIDSVEVTCRSEKSKENYVEEAHISSQQLWMVLFKNIPIRQL